jgi:Zn-dependent protease
MDIDINYIILKFVILAPPFLFALTFHELAHGLVALRLGDPTARNEGRLTMNPLKHLDPLGVLAFIFIRIGWAKPVPVNPVYFQDPYKGMLLVALAGPGANMILAVFSAVIYKLMLSLGGIPMFISYPLTEMFRASVWINVMLAVFNLLPIPPLDGSKILMGVLPRKAAATYARYESYGFVIVLLLFVTGVISKIIFPIIIFFTSLLIA